MSSNINWPDAIKPLLKKYKDKKHPLDYKNTYQLLVMVVLSAQDSDVHINKIAPTLFEAFPNMEALSKATEDSLAPFAQIRLYSGQKRRTGSITGYTPVRTGGKCPRATGQRLEHAGLADKYFGL